MCFLISKILFFETVKSKLIISLFETVRLSVSISPRNLYNPLKSIKENYFQYVHITSVSPKRQTVFVTFFIDRYYSSLNFTSELTKLSLLLRSSG